MSSPTRAPAAREPLSEADVRHVAGLARLDLTDEQVDTYRAQLADVLGHIAHLDELDVDGVEPLAHPIELTNRLAPDVVEPALPVEDVLRNAPATEDRYLAVPKVLG